MRQGQAKNYEPGKENNRDYKVRRLTENEQQNLQWNSKSRNKT